MPDDVTPLASTAAAAQAALRVKGLDHVVLRVADMDRAIAFYEQVLGLHVGFMDTDMTHGLDFAKVSPEEVAVQTLAGVESGLQEVLADDITRTVKQGLSTGIYLAPLQR